MLSHDEALNRATDLISRARRAGADAADVVFAGHESLNVSVRLGALEDVSRSEGSEIGLRIFSGRKNATTSTSDLSSAALDMLVERTLAMARAAPEDPYAGLAPDHLLTKGPFADFDGDDGGEVQPESLKNRALTAEEAALSVAGVSNSQGASASASRSISALATSHGFAGVQSRSYHGISASVLAGDEGAQERDYAYHGAAHENDVDDPATIGREAGQRAVARLKAIRLKSGPMPVILDPRVAVTLIGHLSSAISGSAIARKTSFLLESLGAQLFDTAINIVDDPHRMRALRSRAYDGEGLATRPMKLIDQGVLTSWIADSASARQIGIDPTGHAARGISGAPGASTSNLYLAAGSVSPANLMHDIEEGFYVTELIGMGVDGLTGDYSRGASGHRIVRGELAEAVSEVTIAGNLLTMFKSMTPANDLVFRFAINAPTVRIDGMTLAGD